MQSTNALPNGYALDDAALAQIAIDVNENAKAAEELAPVEATEQPDPFSPETLRLSNDYAADLISEIVRGTVEVSKPNKQDFVRVHPEISLSTTVFKSQEDGIYYLVPPHMRKVLGTALTNVTLYLTVNRHGKPFLWPVPLPDGTGKSVRNYQIERALGNLGEPEWPKESLADLLRLAFKDRCIDRMDHPIVRKLQGHLQLLVAAKKLAATLPSVPSRKDL